MGIDPISIAIFVIAAISTAFQITQAKKQAAKAKRAADARKGFEVPVEGEPGFLPIAYGRNKIGGFRVWHATAGSFTFVTPNADKSFVTGTVNKTGYAYDYTTLVFNPVTGNYERQPGSASVTGGITAYMNQTLTLGGNNEFLFFQQIMCLAPINKVIDVIIDDGRFIDDPALGSYGKIETPTKKKKGVQAALRIDCHYSGGVVDTIIKANSSERGDAKFTDMAYASAAFRLNRDSPQFNGIPVLQFLIEGRKVRTVTGGVLSAGRVYSNNPAWCLLDYLLEPKAGKAVDITEIDLPSFEAAAAVCGQIVQSGVRVGGRIWQSTDGTTFVTSRDLPLYECNMVVDTSKPQRENVESLLSTMGDARLVWSAGQYHLSLQYPPDNISLVLADDIDDDRLVEDQEIQINWPTASERLNYCTVRFHNEFENFKEDSVSWPPKVTASYLRGVGARRYGLPSETGFDDSISGSPLMNNYGVWEGDLDDILITYVFKTNPGENASYTIKTALAGGNVDAQLFEITPGGDVPVPGGSFSFTESGKSNLRTYGPVNLGHATQYKVYRWVIDAHNDEDRKAIAITLENSGRMLWSTRNATYSDFIQVNLDSTVHDLMMEEDGMVPLEMDVFSEGITDPFHALAKAEELVRTSRTAVGFKFKYWINDKYSEPGDFLRVNSQTLALGATTEVFVRVNSVKVSEEGSAEIVGTRFDWTQLAWNVKDDVYITAPNLYDMRPPAPEWIAYAPYTGTEFLSSGILTCASVNGWQGFGQYIWYMHIPGKDPVDPLDGDLIFTEIGRSTKPEFILPGLLESSAFFGVRTMSTSGQLSALTTTDLLVAIDLDLSWLNGLPWVLTPVNLPPDDGAGNVPTDWVFDGGSHGLNWCKSGPIVDWQTWLDAAYSGGGGAGTYNPAGGYHMYQIQRGMAGPTVLKCRIRGNASHAMVGFAHVQMDANPVGYYNPLGATDLNTGFYQHPQFDNAGHLFNKKDYLAATQPSGHWYDYDATPIDGQTIWGGQYSTYWDFEFFQQPPAGDTLVEFVYDGLLMNVFVNNVLARTYYGLNDWDTLIRYPTFYLMSPDVEITNIEWYRGTQTAITPTGWQYAYGSGRYMVDNTFIGGYWETSAPLSPFENTLELYGSLVKGGANLEWSIDAYTNLAFPSTGIELFVNLAEQSSALGAFFEFLEGGTFTSTLRGDTHAETWAAGDTIKCVYSRKKLKVWQNGDRIRNKKIGRNKSLLPYISMPNYSKISNLNIGRTEDDEDYPTATASGTAAVTTISDTTPDTPGAGVGFVEVSRASTVVTDPVNAGVTFSVYATYLYHRTAGAIDYTPELKLQWAVTDGALPTSWNDVAPTVVGTASNDATIRTANINYGNGNYASSNPTLTLWARLVVTNTVPGAYTAAVDGSSVNIQGFTTSAP